MRGSSPRMTLSCPGPASVPVHGWGTSPARERRAGTQGPRRSSATAAAVDSCNAPQRKRAQWGRAGPPVLAGADERSAGARQ
jgi:hypothetical protein